jgi:DNA-binding IclR family transcriptional regulator
MVDQSVLKALKILDTLGESDQGISLSELANTLGFPTSTAHRLLKTLESQGYVEKDSITGRYAIGSKVLYLQIAGTNRLRLVKSAFPHLRALTRITDETANLSTLSDGRVVYLESVAADRAIGLYAPTGSIAPAYCTAMGKVLLANLGEIEFHQWLAEHELTAITANTVTNATVLKSQLLEIRSQGFAIDNEEWVEGVRCVAAPIQDYTGHVIAAASVSIPLARFTPDREQGLLSAVKQTCAAISKELGHR